MIHFPATLEIMLCLIGAIVVGFILGWLFSSSTVGIVAGTAMFLWLIDMVFSFSVEDDGGYDDDDY